MNILWYVYITTVTLIRNNTSHVPDSIGKIHCMFQERGANYISTHSRGLEEGSQIRATLATYILRHTIDSGQWAHTHTHTTQLTTKGKY